MRNQIKICRVNAALPVIVMNHFTRRKKPLGLIYTSDFEADFELS